MRRFLDASPAMPAKTHIGDMNTWGDADGWKLIASASSATNGFRKSTKAMEIPGLGCLVQVSTLQIGQAGQPAVAEAVTFVPGVTIADAMDGDLLVGRVLMSYEEMLERLGGQRAEVDVAASDELTKADLDAAIERFNVVPPVNLSSFKVDEVAPGVGELTEEGVALTP